MGEVGRESSSDLEWDLIQRAARDYGILFLAIFYAEVANIR
jgi:hypothetical protein